MWVVFVDDTKQRGLRRDMGQLLALGGVAFHEEQLASYTARVHDIYLDHAVPESSELKWSPRKGSWFRSDEGAAVLTSVRVACLAAAAECGAKAMAVVFDLGRTRVQGSSAEFQVLKYLFERVEMMLSSTAERAVIVFDKPGGDHRQEDEWIGRTLALTNFGTNFVSPNRVVLPVLTAPSHHHPHLQLADLVAGATTAAVAGVTYGLELIPSLRPMFHVSAAGTIGGTGVKFFPDDLTNLYHWVLGEDAYNRRGWALPLPCAPMPYGEDAGIGRIGALRGKKASKRYGAPGD